MVATDIPVLIFLFICSLLITTIKSFVSHKEKKGWWEIMRNLILTFINLLDQLTINVICSLLPFA